MILLCLFCGVLAIVSTYGLDYLLYRIDQKLSYVGKFERSRK